MPNNKKYRLPKSGTKFKLTSENYLFLKAEAESTCGGSMNKILNELLNQIRENTIELSYISRFEKLMSELPKKIADELQERMDNE